MKKWTFVVLLLVGATILGATVLREPIAFASSPFTSVMVGNTADNPVPVREQGTVNVNVANSPLQVQAAGEPVGISLFQQPGFIQARYTVPANKRLMIQYVSWGNSSVDEMELRVQPLDADWTTSYFHGDASSSSCSSCEPYVFSDNVWIPVPPGATVVVRGFGSWFLTIDGYLTNA